MHASVSFLKGGVGQIPTRLIENVSEYENMNSVHFYVYSLSVEWRSISNNRYFHLLNNKLTDVNPNSWFSLV